MNFVMSTETMSTLTLAFVSNERDKFHDCLFGNRLRFSAQCICLTSTLLGVVHTHSRKRIVLQRVKLDRYNDL